MSTSERSDDPLTGLVQAARAGDEGAFRDLVDRVYARIHRWALARTGHPDDADDVAQGVLVRLHRHLDGWDGRARFETWLYRVTANTAASLVATRARTAARERRGGRTASEATGPGSSSGSPSEVGGPGPLERVWLEDVTGLVRTFFEELPPRQREIFDLADLQGYAPAEIAEMLEMNPSTVRANLFKARRTLRGRVLERHPELARGYGR